MVATQKAVNGFSIPKRTARLVFSGDYEGAEVVVRLDVSVGTWLEIQELLQGEKQMEVYALFGRAVLENWNLLDSDGNPVEADSKGMHSIPIDLANTILEQWTQAIVGTPVPLGENLNGGGP